MVEWEWPAWINAARGYSLEALEASATETTNFSLYRTSAENGKLQACHSPHPHVETC